MPAEQIKSDLKRLQDELGATTSIDPELKSLLIDLDRDIKRLLAGEEPPAEVEQGLVARIEGAASEFEIQHPQAAGILRRLADALGQIGI